MKICVLASGSTGNSVYIEANKTRLLIDAGISAKQLEKRLSNIGVCINDINAICISHEHSDHIKGIKVIQNRFQIPIYTNQGTHKAIQNLYPSNELNIKLFQTGSEFKLEDLVINSFMIPHDALEPVGFKIKHKDKSIGIVTDLGIVSPLVIDNLKGCNCIITEANYDEDLLMEAPRPWRIKQRIRSRQGHLSNTDTAQLIKNCYSDSLQHVIIGHLSSECNSPDIALKTILSQLSLDGITDLSIDISTAKNPTDILEI